ncbi:MAG TPA: hypothetical protein VMY77_14460 [Chitinophagaceae bacterium]|nr:hypothetical protein [Chitinophagaceae bacterium]
MKEHPIIFSTPMVKAIIDGRKTQTRRIIKFPSDFNHKNVYKNYPFGVKYTSNIMGETVQRLFPKWKVGDILWVKETYNKISIPDGIGERKLINVYKADNSSNYLERIKWKPSIFMPRAAARIFLEVTDVRAEQLQSITEQDAIAEGVDFDYTMVDGRSYVNYLITHPSGKQFACFKTAIQSYCSLWEKINPGSWILDPWVWVIEFKKLEKI